MQNIFTFIKMYLLVIDNCIQYFNYLLNIHVNVITYVSLIIIYQHKLFTIIQGILLDSSYLPNICVFIIYNILYYMLYYYITLYNIILYVDLFFIYLFTYKYIIFVIYIHFITTVKPI